LDSDVFQFMKPSQFTAVNTMYRNPAARASFAIADGSKAVGLKVCDRL
jgi:hypothetical protein